MATWWLVRVKLRLSSEERSRKFKINAENRESDCRNGKHFCCGGCVLWPQGRVSPLLPPKMDRKESQLGND